jgi:hypothetical protein
MTPATNRPFKVIGAAIDPIDGKAHGVEIALTKDEARKLVADFRDFGAK